MLTVLIICLDDVMQENLMFNSSDIKESFLKFLEVSLLFSLCRVKGKLWEQYIGSKST